MKMFSKAIIDPLTKANLKSMNKNQLIEALTKTKDIDEKAFINSELLIRFWNKNG